MSHEFKFIPLLFPDGKQERVAMRLLHGLGAVLGDRVDQIRPDTGVTQIFEWAWQSRVDTVDLVTAFEVGIAMEADELPEGFEQMTFRELVECVSNLEQTIV